MRLRLINAGTDTAFRVALAGHRMTVTHTDGFPVIPKTTDALVIGMGERFDVEVTLDDGVFPLVAVAEGKVGAVRGLIRTGVGRVPGESFRPSELNRRFYSATTWPPRTACGWRPRLRTEVMTWCSAARWGLRVDHQRPKVPRQRAAAGPAG